MTRRSKLIKNLLFVVLVICVVGAGYKIVVEPLLLTASNNEATYAKLQEEKVELDAISVEISEADAVYDENVATLEELKSDIGVYLENEELATTIISIAEEKGVSVQELNVVQEVTEYMIEDLQDITVKAVTLTVTGSTQQFLNLQEEFYNRTDCIISNMSMDTEDNVMVVTVVIYMQSEA